MFTHRAKALAGARMSRVNYRCRNDSVSRRICERKDSILPDDVATLTEQRRKTVRARHAASLLVWRAAADATEILMGMRGARHRFMPNRLVFPGGAVDRADLSAPFATPLPSRTEMALRSNANAQLAHAL